MRIKVNWTTVLVSSILFINYSMMCMELVSATVRAATTIAVSAVILFIIARRRNNGFSIRVVKKIYILALILTTLIVVSCLVNGFNIQYDFYTIFLIFISAFFASEIERESFYESYVSSMCFFSFFGTAIYLLYRFFPVLFSFFPKHIWHGSIEFKNCILCVVQTNSQFIRNYGVFYEPGMFSFFLIIAIYFALFKTNPNFKKIAVLVVALLSALSTNGYICAALLFLAFFFVKTQFSRKIKRRILILLVGLVVFVIIFFAINPTAFSFLVDKFSEINMSGEVSMRETGSGYERWRSVILALEAIWINPIFGVAANGWQTLFSNVIGTATPLNWFGMYGLLYGLIMNFFYLKSAVISTGGNSRYIISAIGMIVFILNCMSQNVSNCIIVLMLIFYAAADMGVKAKSIRR